MVTNFWFLRKKLHFIDDFMLLAGNAG